MSLFNLAKSESTFPDGSRMSFQKDGEIFYSLVPLYTDGHGHLNEIGRKKIAESFLLLANID